MKGIFIGLIAVAALAVGGGVFLRSKGMTLSSLLASIQSTSIPAPKIAVGANPMAGQVMGATTTQTSTIGSQVAALGTTIAKLAQVVGIQTVATGQTLVNNVTTTPTSQADTINMANVVHDISARVESIPGGLVTQAKIEYCKQVLQAATASASQK